MAKKDAIFNYSSAFDTSSYLTDIESTWTDNAATHRNIRHDMLWSGDPDGTPGTALSGWDVGTFKLLKVHDIPNDATYLTRDSGTSNKIDNTAVHRLIRNIKTAFNLPNVIDVDAWPNEYTCANDEQHSLNWTSKDVGAYPICMNASGGWMRDGRTGDHVQCALVVTISGYDDYGSGANVGSWTVWPTSTNFTTYNSHYQGLVDASTAVASYTDPTKVGTEFVEAGNVVLLNLENQHKPTAVSRTKDQLSLSISWSNKSYADIKSLIDAAIA